jgi:hypothetical protein
MRRSRPSPVRAAGSHFEARCARATCTGRLTRDSLGRPRPQVPRSTFAEKARFAALAPFNLILRAACVRFETFLALFVRLTPAFLDWAARWRARATFYRAARHMRAYRQFLRSAGYRGGSPPESDKETYIKRYRTDTASSASPNPPSCGTSSGATCGRCSRTT